MEDVLGGLAFAGIIAAQFLAVVVAHNAKWNDGASFPSDLSEAPNFAGDERTKAPLATMHARDICAEGYGNKALPPCDGAVLGLAFPVGASR